MLFDTLGNDDVAFFTTLTKMSPGCLRHMFSTKSTTESPNTASLACAMDSPAILTYILGIGGGMNSLQDVFGLDEAPVSFFAASGNATRTLKILHDNGASMEAKDKAGNTLLHIACESDSVQVVDFLLGVLSAPGNVLCMKNSSGLTPLHTAIIHRSRLCVARILEKFPALVHQSSVLGLTPLHLACMSIGGGDVDIVQDLLRAGANVDDQNNGQQISPLHFACAIDSSSVAGAVLRAGACIDAKDANGFTPVHVCALNSSFTSAALCIQAGADLTVKSDEDQSALHIACRKGDSKLVLYLLSVCGGNKDNMDAAGKTPLMAAVEQSHDGIVAILLRNGARVPRRSSEAKSKLDEVASLALVSSYMSPSTTLTSSATKVVQLLDMAQGGLTPASAAVFSRAENDAARLFCSALGRRPGLLIASFLGRGFLARAASSPPPMAVTTAMAVDSDLKRRVEEALSGDSSDGDGFVRPMPRKRQRAGNVDVVRARNMSAH